MKDNIEHRMSNIEGRSGPGAATGPAEGDAEPASAELRSGRRATPNPSSPSYGAAGAQRSTQRLFEEFVVPSYGRFDLVLERGEGSYLWDADGKRYLDFGGGIAVCSLGHANAEVADALNAQARKLTHVSNLYYTEPQGRLAARLVDLIGPGRVFFCNSGAEANEGLYKLARRVGHDSGRFEIITATNSFHGRTLAGIAATGQEKVKKGFGPAVAGFKQVPFNDLEAMRGAISESTIAILIEPVQGESGITIATAEYLRGLRDLCDERNLLLMFDEVQAGHFRTGNFHSWQTILDLSGRVGVSPAASGVAPDAPAPGATFARRRRLPHFEFPWAIYAITIATLNKRVLSPESRTLVLNAICHFHRSRYELFAACVMPDHVHILFQPSIKEHDSAGKTVLWSLGELMHSIKSFTAKQVNKLEGTSGSIWEQERFDRFVRGDRDLEEKFLYIVSNPWKAQIVSDREEYQWIWTRDDVAGTMPAPAGETPTIPGKDFLPDAVSMAKALGGGFPMGAFWVAEKHGAVLGAGSHATTFGGTPLACAVALKILDVVERDHLGENARSLGEFMLKELRAMAAKYPRVLRDVRGLGLMIGVEFEKQFQAGDVVKRLHQGGLLTIPAGTSVIRLLPALNLSRGEAEEGLRAIEDVIRDLAETKESHR